MTSSFIATVFLPAQRLARPMPSSRARPTRAGCVSILSRFIIMTTAGMPGHPLANAGEAGMNSESRRKIEMGTRALEFNRAHPDTEPGSATAAARLEQLLARAKETAAVQRDGLVHVHAAATRKRELRRWMREVPIPHLAEVGRAAAREEHELGKTFSFRPGASTYFAFRTAARSMVGSAQEHRELLVKYGLSQSVLDQFVQALDQLDAAVGLGNDGRTAHVGATRDLRSGATEIVRTVRVMDARNRQRFADDEQLLGSWINASTVLAGRGRTRSRKEGRRRKER
jgi:hypothetical protein